MFRGLMNPENYHEGGGGFQEGLVKVVDAAYTVVAPPARQGQEARAPFFALVLKCNRLDEDTQEPVLDDDTGEPKVEDIAFSFGGKSLGSLHPGGASSPPMTEDEAKEVEDLGDEPGTEGPTVYVVKDDFRINPQAPIAYFAASLHQGRKPKKDSRVADEFSGCGCPAEIVDVPWAPQFVGLVCHIKNFTSKFEMEGRPMTYKVIDKIISAPWEKKAGKAKGAGTGAGSGAVKTPPKPAAAGKKETTAAATSAPAASANGAGSDEEQALVAALMNLSASQAGEKLTVKALWQATKKQLEEDGVEGAMKTKALSILMTKANVWLPSHAGEFDATVHEEGGKVVAVEFGG